MSAAEARSNCVRQGSSTWSHCQHMNNFSLRLTLWQYSITGTLYLGKGAPKRCTHKTTWAGPNGQCVLSQRPFLPLLSYSGRIIAALEWKRFLLQRTLNFKPHRASLCALQRWVEGKIWGGRGEADPELDPSSYTGSADITLSWHSSLQYLITVLILPFGTLLQVLNISAVAQSKIMCMFSTMWRSKGGLLVCQSITNVAKCMFSLT